MKEEMTILNVIDELRSCRYTTDGMYSILSKLTESVIDDSAILDSDGAILFEGLLEGLSDKIAMLEDALDRYREAEPTYKNEK